MQNVIEKSITMNAPQSQVWKALTDHRQFSAWFTIAIDGPFVAGKTARGTLTHPRYAGVEFDFDVVAMDPETYFAYKWHPFAIEPGVDYSQEQKTLVEFRLEAAAGGGTLLRVKESGFGALPEARQEAAFKANDGGWAQQMANIDKYVRENSIAEHA